MWERLGISWVDMPVLGDHSNVYNTVFLILQRKGYRAWYDEGTSSYGCERDGWDFLADSPTALLGLVAIFEFKRPAEYREYWWREDGARLYESLPKTPPEYTPVWQRR
jgi:hypothetical protein